jgi:hypothetical protein
MTRLILWFLPFLIWSHESSFRRLFYRGEWWISELCCTCRCPVGIDMCCRLNLFPWFLASGSVSCPGYIFWLLIYMCLFSLWVLCLPFGLGCYSPVWWSLSLWLSLDECWSWFVSSNLFSFFFFLFPFLSRSMLILVRLSFLDRCWLVLS